MLDLLRDLGQQRAGFTDQVGFDFEAIDQSGCRTLFDDAAQLIDGLRDMCFRLRAARMIEREAANQLRPQCDRRVDRATDFGLQVIVEGHELVVRAVIDIDQFHLTDAGSDAGDLQAVFVLHLGDCLEVVLIEIDDVLHLSGRVYVDETRAVVPQSDSGQRGELFESGLAIGGLVRERAEEHLRVV